MKRQYSVSCAFVRGELHFKTVCISYFYVFKPVTVNIKNIMQPLDVVLALGSPCIPGTSLHSTPLEVKTLFISSAVPCS